MNSLLSLVISLALPDGIIEMWYFLTIFNSVEIFIAQVSQDRYSGKGCCACFQLLHQTNFRDKNTIQINKQTKLCILALRARYSVVIYFSYPNVKIMPIQINNVHDNHIKIYIFFMYVPEGIKRFTIKHMYEFKHTRNMEIK